MSKRPFVMPQYKTYDPSVEGYGDPRQWKSALHERMSKEEAQAAVGDEDPLEILGASETATLDDIRKAYRKACRTWHPDLHRQDGQYAKAEEMMRMINAAFVLLEEKWEAVQAFMTQTGGNDCGRKGK